MKHAVIYTTDQKRVFAQVESLADFREEGGMLVFEDGRGRTQAIPKEKVSRIEMSTETKRTPRPKTITEDTTRIN